MPRIPFPTLSGIPTAWRKVFALVTCFYLVSHAVFAFVVGPFDYDLMSTYYELAWRFWKSGDWIPHYNPFLDGGRTLGGDPQIPIFHPAALLVPWLSAPIVVRLEMLFQLSLGAYGMAQVLRWFSLDRTAVCWGTFLFVAGGAVVARFLVGHVTLGFFLFYPLFLYLGYRVADSTRLHRWRWRVAYILLFAYGGWYKPNFFIYAVPPILFEAVVRSTLQRRWRPILEFLFALGFGSLLVAVSVIPAAVYFRAFPRTQDVVPHAVPWYTAFFNLLLPLKTLPASLYGEGFRGRHEYNLCIGIVGLWFAARGLRLLPRFSDRPYLVAWLALGLASFALGLGRTTPSLHPLEPFSWLHSLWPGFESVRVSARFWFGLYCAAIVFSALGHRAPSEGKKALYWGLGVVPLLLQLVVNLWISTADADATLFTASRKFPSTISWVEGGPFASFDRIREGHGVLQTHENIEVARSKAVVPGDTLEMKLSGPALAKAEWRGWSRIHLDVTGMPSEKILVELNLNHHPYWRTEDPTAEIRSAMHDRLRVESDGGEIHTDLVFEQPQSANALRISAAAWIFLFFATAGFWAWNRRPRKRLIGITGPIGSGKSSLGRHLSETPGVEVHDLDQLGKDLLREDASLQQKLLVFARNHGCLTPDGKEVDRKRLRLAISASPNTRRKLERLMQPAILQEFRRRARTSTSRVVIGEAALWVQHGAHTQLDALVGCFADREQRRHRVQTRDAMPASASTEAWLSLQEDTHATRRVCDESMENEGSPEHWKLRSEELLRHWKHLRWL